MNSFKIILIILFGISVLGCNKEAVKEEPTVDNPIVWKFAVVGDTHVTNNSDTIAEMIPYFIEDGIDLILIAGDIVEGGKNTTGPELEAELELWLSIFKPLYDNGIGVYPIRGNHEDDANNNLNVWNRIFSGDKALPQNGPSGEVNLTYSFTHKNALFIGLDTYVNIHKINQTWLDEQLSTNELPHIFTFGHEAAFKVFHSDCLDDFPTERNTFWQSLTDAGARTYFCGHDHFFDATEIDDSDGNDDNNIYQCLVGGGGGWLMPHYNYNGDNSNYNVEPIYHSEAHGYALIEVSGESANDLDVTITWKERIVEGNTVKYIAASDVIEYQIPAK